ncbi:hypothetical protein METBISCDRAFT_22800 [Metschnikowia bicuspidata]|uniref:BZIP domain-containing protein n=1 Tax=Metschnikowia bicuspidata TaxID=27322 RepID=A0A4P9ZDJ2_9ASCO|nr:hypothetical protein METBISCDRAFT_22800 [Metschnikowia bicuspidata]
MNFHPKDYLADLNVDFDGPSMSPVEKASKVDLNIFTETEFFDLDVFSSDLAPENKQQMQSYVAAPIKRVLLDCVPGSERPYTGFSPIYAPTRPAIVTERMSQEELNKIKRKKNTAASARFRIKKKLKEKQMEQEAHKLRERLEVLEKRLKTLEIENKCLEQLMIKKNEEKNSVLLDSIKKRSLGDSRVLL